MLRTESLWLNAPPSFLAPSLRSSHAAFSTSTPTAASIKQVKKNDSRDTYTLRQARARRDANLSRQAVLKEQRAKELGDPIRGITTPFVKSFDTVVPQDNSQDKDTSGINLEAVKINPNESPPSPAHASKEYYLNHGFSHAELKKSLDFSRVLTEPPMPKEKDGTFAQSEQDATERRRWETRNESATEAVQRIVSLANASNKHRTKKNVERIVQRLGRHNTDATLKPKASANVKRNILTAVPEPTPRAGPDTGSSEVQIGILTAKIRVLADRYQGENRNDKINKRNLRLLLHRRQKLLKYMEKKERGSERWQKMIETLGLTPATWHGQIAVE